MSKLLRLLGIGWVLTMVLAGCAGVGQKSFACPGRPPGVHCMSATEVYDATHTTDAVAPTAAHALGSDPRKGPRKASGRGERSEATDPPLSRSEALAAAVEKPIPIRTPAQVMRAWIAPRGIGHDVLDSGGYLFIEVESRHWAMGDAPLTNQPVRFFSIQNAVDTKEPVGKDRSPPNGSAGASERMKRTSPLPKEPSHVSNSPEPRS